MVDTNAYLASTSAFGDTQGTNYTQANQTTLQNAALQAGSAFLNSFGMGLNGKHILSHDNENLNALNNIPGITNPMPQSLNPSNQQSKIGSPMQNLPKGSNTTVRASNAGFKASKQPNIDSVGQLPGGILGNVAKTGINQPQNIAI